MFVTVAEENNNSTEYTSEILTPLYVGQQLTDDRISPMAALMSKKFRLEFEDEIKPEDIEASIAEAFYGDDEENGKENKKE